MGLRSGRCGRLAPSTRQRARVTATAAARPCPRCHPLIHLAAPNPDAWSRSRPAPRRSLVAAPRDAQTTVVGGGAVGAAVAYFLAREGWADVQLLDKGELC